MGELAKDSRDEPWRADSAVEALVARRVAARRAGDFRESDRVRVGLAALGVFVLDTSHDEGAGRVVETRHAPASGDARGWLRVPPSWGEPAGCCKHWRHKRRAYCGSAVAGGTDTPAAIWSGLQEAQDSAADGAAGGGDGMLDISRLHYCSDCIARHELSGRCPCPFDPRHSVLLTKLSGHLRLCQSKPGVSAAAGENGAVVPRSGGADAQVPGINADGEGSDEA